MRRILQLLLLLGGSLFFVVLAAYAGWQGGLGDVDGPIGWFLIIVIAAAGIAGTAYAILHLIHRPLQELSDDEPGERLVSEFRVFRVCQVIVDLTREKVGFTNCHVPRRFLGWPQAWYQCDFDDVLDAHRMTFEGHTTLVIVTTHGKATVPETATNFAELLELVGGISDETPSGPQTEHPYMPLVLMVAALGGFFAGWAVTPMTASNAVLGVVILVTMLAAVALAYLVIQYLDRRIKFPLVRTLGHAILGATAATGLATALPMGEIAVIVLLLLGGAVLGVLFGALLQR